MTWPRRGNEWDVFDVDGSGILEIERCDEVSDEMTDALWDDDAAVEFVFSTASRPPDDCPPEVTAECRAAVREIVASWSLKGDSEPRWKRYDCTLLRDGEPYVTLTGRIAGRLVGLSRREVRDVTTRVVKLLNADEPTPMERSEIGP